MDKITAAIKSRRDALHLTDTALSSLTGIPYGSLRRKIEHPGTFTVSQFAALARALRCTVYDIWPIEDGNGAAA